MSTIVRYPNVFYGLGRKPRRRRQRGAGFFDKLKSGINWLKDKKVISTVAKALAPTIKHADKVASVSSALGFGSRRPMRKVKRKVGGKKTRKVGGKKRKVYRRIGRGFWSNLGSAALGVNKFLRDNKVISSVGNALGSVGVPYASQIGRVAGNLGYGKKRRRAVRYGGAYTPALTQFSRPLF